MTDHSAEIVATCETAISYLGDHGRAVKAYLKLDGQACLTGALAIAKLGGRQNVTVDNMIEGLNCPAIPAVAGVIADQYADRLPPALASTRSRGAIFAFNDSLQTSDEDVIEVLREVIKRHTVDEYRQEAS